MAGAKGFALLTTIILILVIAAVILGIVSFIVNSTYLMMAKSSQETALYAAQAGIYWAITDYRTDNSFTKITSDRDLITDIESFKVGTDANLLLVDAERPLGILTNNLNGIGLTNIGIAPVTISRVVVEWDFGGNMTRVTLGGASAPVYSWTGSIPSPADVILNRPYTIAAGGSYANNNFTFTGAIPIDSVITATFYCSGDDSGRKAILYNNGRSGNKEFSITATGKVVAGKFTWRKTIEATYDVGTSTITSWSETENHL
ncbi:MAG: type II secretion system protein [Candidatus Omnitrophica bacterium]|nr:type II secretion system protein [Candidatus Omnitrophota bacterium]MDD5436680.1 type II secretion system protein [Candidatus Omnitrophota bacterium]